MNNRKHLPAKSTAAQNIIRSLNHQVLFFPEAAPASATGDSIQRKELPAPHHRLSEFSILPKLKVGAPGNQFEREADRMADIVTEAPSSVLHTRQVGDEASLSRGLQRKDTGATENHSPSPLDTESTLVTGRGRPLDRGARLFFEPKFGHDFSRVRIHDDRQAAQKAQSLRAHAYTIGPDITFGDGQYNPQSDTGKRLLAHELTHVVQQGASSPLAPADADHPPAYSPRPVLSPILQANFLEDAVDFISDEWLDEVPDFDLLNLTDLDMIRNFSIIDDIFEKIVTTNRLSASSQSIPESWRDALIEYSQSHPEDGIILLGAWLNWPTFYEGGWILDVQTGASAITLDRSVFFKDELKLSTYIHELVHVWQFDQLGTTGFLTSYFGMSAAAILYGLLSKEPIDPMKSSPHETQAYGLEERFNQWYRETKNEDPDSVVP